MQKEIITGSGAILRYDMDNIVQCQQVLKATQVLGGAVVALDYDVPRETVLKIMDKNIVGTTLTSSDGILYTLFADGWHSGIAIYPTAPPHEDIVSATMPGGWSWSRQYETYDSAESSNENEGEQS